MRTPYSDIARVLGGARRRQGWIVLATAACCGGAGALAFILIGVSLLGAGVGPPMALRRGALTLASLALLAALAWAAAALLRRASSPLAVARAVGSAAPELRDDLLTSVELEEDYDAIRTSGRYSVALVDAHIARTAERATRLDLRRVVSAAPARRALGVLAAAAVANVAAVAAAPRAVVAGWTRLLDAAAVPVRQAEPITGDVEVTYVYPAYMHRETKVVSGTGGEVSAPKGTEVRLKTRSDRPVQAAEVVVESGEPREPEQRAGVGAGGRREGEPGARQGAGASAERLAATRPDAAAPAPATHPLEVTAGRDLAGGFLLERGGAYLFRFKKGSDVVAQGPPIPITVEPDLFPEVRITSPKQEIEVDASAQVHIEWTASDDVGLAELTLVTKAPHGEERRTVLRSFSGTRRESGAHDLALAPFRLSEGERLLYWLEAADGDAISGPKRAASATHTVKVYSEAEHRRAALARAQALWEDLVRLLGDRLELLDGAPAWTSERLAKAEALDARARGLHESMRKVALELRSDRSVPRELPVALVNVAAGIRQIEADLTALRPRLGAAVRFRQDGNAPLLARVADLDGRLDRELEKDALYLERLFDKQRADDLVRVARDLAARRRDLASLLERYRQSPTEAAKKELLTEIARMRGRMAEMMRRMSELAKGIEDEHMNAEALAELARSGDALGGLDEVEKMLARGDVEGAQRALDRMGSAMQQMLASLERTAGGSARGSSALMKDVLAFRKDLAEVRSEQEGVARETEAVKGAYGKRVAEKLREMEPAAKRLERLAGEAREELSKAEKGVSLRSEDDYAQARDRLADLEKALQARDFDAALEAARRGVPSLQRLALGLSDDAVVAERYRALQPKDPREVRDALRHAQGALDPARRVKQGLEEMFPDPRSVLSEREQQALGELARREGALERRAGGLRQQLSELSQRAPVFPPQAQQSLEGSQGHMRRAEGELAQRNPQRGHGEQRQALDELARLERGLDDMVKRSQGASGGGGFPLPFGGEQGGEEGEGSEPSQEKVEIPGADAYRVPDEFRRDLLEAMKQGAPEAYKGEVQRYYEELVK